ncbi:MAG: hypothetical protein CMJ65_02150 [Planctomycetaceae bacterium]|jgi:hypothetical protein|nr:hypothetical protein [Planctomycetaceae bacterium]
MIGTRPPTLRGLLLLLVVLAATSNRAWPEPSATPTVTQHDVEAILLRHCTVCHGRRHKEGGLSLLDRKSLLKGGKSGPAIIVRKGTTQEQAAALRSAQTRFDAANNLLQRRIPELTNRLRKQFPTGKAEPASSGLVAHFPLDGPATQVVKDKLSKHDAVYYGPGALKTTSGHGSQDGTPQHGALFLNGSGQHLDAGNHSGFRSDQPFTCSAWIKPADHVGAIITKINEPNDFRGIDFTTNRGLLEVHLVDKWPVNAIKVVPETVRLTTDQWHHVLFSYDGSKKANGVKIYIDGVRAKLKIFFDTLTGSFDTPDPWRIGRRKTSAYYRGSIDDVRIYSRVLDDADVMLLAADNRHLKQALKIAAQKEADRTQTEKETLLQYFVERDDNVSKRKQELQQLKMKPGDSLILKRIRSGHMPPKDNLLNTGTRPLKARDIVRLEEWINSGAPEVALPLETAGGPADPLVDGEDRSYWAFQPPQHITVPEPPAGRVNNRIRNPIDAFVAVRLKEANLEFSPTADRGTLARRACFDLHGLPPSPAQLQRFLDDGRPGAFSRLIDRLLASPRYGERWGRHWLDAVGYADSFGGKLAADHLRPYAWRYRDYVIRAFNADKPYDRFLLEQLAGDELADYSNPAEITQEIYDNLVATGFMRMAPDSTSEREVSFISDRLDVIADQIDIFSSVVLGLTLKCGRCHDHKYDPFPQRDYYRLTAIFKGAFDENDWLKPVGGTEKKYKFGIRRLNIVSTDEKDENDRLQIKINNVQHKVNVEADRLRKGLPEKQKKLGRNELIAHLLKSDKAFKAFADPLLEQVRTLESRRPPAQAIQALWDRGTPSPTYILIRGDHDNPGRVVSPGVPAVLSNPRVPFVVRPPWKGATQTGRRLALARWVTQPEHPLTSRVMINRIWKHHFARGLVASLSNFGQTGFEPTHPGLLDWLAGEFVTRGWRIKAMHRLMMNTTTYCQSSSNKAPHSGPSASQRKDPLNEWFSRMPLKRMEAELVRDTALWVADRLNSSQFGPADPVTVRKDGLVTAKLIGGGWRRSVYLRQRRKEFPTFLSTFDLPSMSPNCIERPESTVATQALYMMNNATIDQLATSFARRIRGEIGEDRDRQIQRAHLLAFSRTADNDELKAGRAALKEFTRHWARHLESVTKTKNRKSAAPASQRALASYCHVLLNSASFLYID